MAASMCLCKVWGYAEKNIRENVILKSYSCRSFAKKYNSILSYMWLKNRNYSHLINDENSSKTYHPKADCKEDDNFVTKKNLKEKLRQGPSLGAFIQKSSMKNDQHGKTTRLALEFTHPYFKAQDVHGNGNKVYFEVFGCQMNVNDTEIAWSILKSNGYEKTTDVNMADVILVMTCSIREGAEQKVWNMLHHFKKLKRKRSSRNSQLPVKIGILGCMAERLKEKLLEKEKCIDVIAGPDSYRDLPQLLANAESGQAAVNVLLSYDETYADVTPVRLQESSKSAYVSIMRGCDNMCSYCIVPFTRGRERSRPMNSILNDVRHLSEQGVKEIILLGQNVNSYRDTSEGETTSTTVLSSGFNTVYKLKKGGLRFADLLDKVSEINPEMRIRFTSPHPKDFPDDVLHLIKQRPNICKQIHLPAQSGNNRILELMRRGYTREAYLKLVEHIRSLIPDVALTSDFICGFGEETEEEFCDTLSLIKEVKFNFAFVFPYSMREKTRAYHHLTDTVPHLVKIDRLNRMSTVFRECAENLNRKKINSKQLVLVEGFSKRSNSYLCGRNDQNTKVIFPLCEIPEDTNSAVLKTAEMGDYVVVHINDAGSQVLKGIPLYHSTIQKFEDEHIDRSFFVQVQ